jgi:hypothetical protein
MLQSWLKYASSNARRRGFMVCAQTCQEAKWLKMRAMRK